MFHKLDTPNTTWYVGVTSQGGRENGVCRLTGVDVEWHYDVSVSPHETSCKQRVIIIFNKNDIYRLSPNCDLSVQKVHQKYSRHELTLLPWWGMKWRFLTTTLGPLYVLFIGLALLVDKTEGWLSKSRLNWCDWIDSNQRRPQKHILCPGIFTVCLL